MKANPFKYKSNAVVRTCRHCGNPIIGGRNRRFCNADCSRAFAKQTARDKTTKPENPFLWVFLRDGFRCQICGKTPADGVKLHADHIYPISKGGTSDEENLITLCGDCNCGKSDKVLPEAQLFSLWDITRKNCLSSDYKTLRDKYLAQVESVHIFRGGE